MPALDTVTYDKNSIFHQRVELYRGSVSVVYKAICATSKRTVIVKAYKTHKMSAKQLHKAKREIALMQTLRSDPGVVRYLGHFEDQYMTFIIMEYCCQGDLFRAVFLKGGSVDEAWAVTQVVAPLLEVLTRLHAMNILHRDIKPENIFLAEGSQLKLGDFGLALDANQELPFTRSGTLDYMAPEVLANPATDLTEGFDVTMARLAAKNVKPSNDRVDVWAVGILCYELVVGRPPFEVENEQYTMNLIMNSNKINFPPQFSKDWASFITLALNKKPELRPSAAELLEHPFIQRHMGPSLLERSYIRHARPQSALMAKRNSAPSGLQGAVVTAAAEVAKMSLRTDASSGVLHQVMPATATGKGLPPRGPQPPSERSKDVAVPKGLPPTPNSPASPLIGTQPRAERPVSAMQAKRPAPLQMQLTVEPEQDSKNLSTSPQSVLHATRSSSASSITSGSPPQPKREAVGNEEYDTKHINGIRSRIKLYFQRQMGRSAPSRPPSN